MNFVTNVFKKYINKIEVTQRNPNHNVEPPPKIEIIPATPVDPPFAERGGKSEDEETFEDASEINATLNNKDTPMLDYSKTGHIQTERMLFPLSVNNDEKNIVLIEGIHEADDVPKSKTPQSNPIDPNIMADSLEGLPSQLIQDSPTLKDSGHDTKTTDDHSVSLSEIQSNKHQNLDEGPLKDHPKLNGIPQMNKPQDTPIPAEATEENIEEILIKEVALKQIDGLEFKTLAIAGEGRNISEPVGQLEHGKITDKGEDSRKDEIHGNRILIGATLEPKQGAAMEYVIINTKPNTPTDNLKTHKGHIEEQSNQDLNQIKDHEEAQNDICMDDIVKVLKLDSAGTYAEIDSNKRYLERQDTKEFEKIEKQLQKEEVEIHKIENQGVAGSYIIEENEELLLDDIDKILNKELGRSNNINYMRQDTREFERLEKQFIEKSKPCNPQIEDILEQLVEESINNVTENLKYPNNSSSLGKGTQKQNIAASERNLSNLISETLTKQELKSNEVEAAIDTRPLGTNDMIFKQETNIFEEAEKDCMQGKNEPDEFLDVDMRTDTNTQLLKDSYELEKKSLDSSLETVIHISQTDIESVNATRDEKKISDLISNLPKIKPEGKQARSDPGNCQSLDENTTNCTSNISVFPEASISTMKNENIVTETTKAINKSVIPIDTGTKTPAKNKVEVRPTFHNKQNSQIAVELSYPEIDENEELKKKVISLQQELKSLKNLKADKNLFSSSAEATLPGDMSKYRKLLGEYEQQIALQAAELNKLKQESEKNMRHFTNTEMAFSDVFEKYEKAKVVISAYRRNEEVLLENIEMAEEQVITLENKCAVMKEQSIEQIRNAQEQVKYEKEKYKQEVTKLQAQIKRLEIKASSLELGLKQKNEECQALAALCDDITGKTSN